MSEIADFLRASQARRKTSVTDEISGLDAKARKDGRRKRVLGVIERQFYLGQAQHAFATPV